MKSWHQLEGESPCKVDKNRQGWGGLGQFWPKIGGRQLWSVPKMKMWNLWNLFLFGIINGLFMNFTICFKLYFFDVL